MSDTTADDGDFDGDFLARRRRDLEYSVEYFRSSDYQPDRERLVVRDFLTNLGVAFCDSDLVLMPVGEPVDVSFRGACFQVKEIMDQGRKRGDEFEEALEKARKATKASDLLVHYTPEDATLVDICNQQAGEGCMSGSEWVIETWPKDDALKVEAERFDSFDALLARALVLRDQLKGTHEIRVIAPRASAAQRKRLKDEGFEAPFP